MTSRFVRYDLRTTEPDAARRFYADALGIELAVGMTAPASAALVVWPLHENARARGAPNHWLGAVGVPDVAAEVARLRERGGEMLGATTLTGPDGVTFAMTRDGGGALLSLRGRTEAPAAEPVAWHQLHTRDLEASWKAYVEMFGWKHAATVEAPDLEGGHRLFAWGDSGEPVGSVANTARWPGVHPHWLFYFPVPDLDAAAAKVRDGGGKLVADAKELPSGDRLWPAEDPHGAAFGLFQRQK